MRVTDENVFEVMEPYLEGATVLEIGTGDGFRTEALLEYAKEVVGLEPDSERLAEAEERLKGKSVTGRKS